MPPLEPSVLGQELKKGEKISANLPWRLLLFMIILLGMTILIYAGMEFGYRPYLNSEINGLDNKIADLNKRVEAEQPKALATLYSQLVNIQTLLGSHAMPSRVFDFLSGNTDPNVYYANLGLSLGDRSLRMDGVAVDYTSLSRQLALFRRKASVRTVFLDDSQTRQTGDVQFTIRLILDPHLFK